MQSRSTFGSTGRVKSRRFRTALVVVSRWSVWLRSKPLLTLPQSIGHGRVLTGQHHLALGPKWTSRHELTFLLSGWCPLREHRTALQLLEPNPHRLSVGQVRCTGQVPDEADAGMIV